MSTSDLNTPIFLNYHFDLNDRSLEPQSIFYAKWLDNLPQGRVQMCADQLLQSMNNFNRVQLDPALRQKLLLLYLKKIKVIFPTLELELERPEGVGHEVTRRTALTMVALYTTLFQGLRICLAQRIAKPALLNREQVKLELFTLILESIREILVLTGMYHVVPPKLLWLMCHEIYNYLGKEGYLNKAYKNHKTLGVLYRQILMLGMLPHSRINPNAFKWLREKLFSYAPQLDIYLSDYPLASSSGFYVELNQDYPPRFFAKPPNDPNKDWRRLDCRSITDSLEAELQQVEASGHIFSDDAVLLRLIVLEWSYNTRRRHARERTQENVWLQTQMGSVWEILRVKDWHLGQVLVGGRFAVHPVMMTLVNKNDVGWMITGDPQSAALQIGELIITRAEKTFIWSLGVIRWLMVHSDGLNVDCGIEHLSFEAEAVEVMPTLGQGNAYYMPALRLPAQPKIGKGPSLVLIGRPFTRLREFKVKDEQGHEDLVRLSRLALQTPFYQFAEFLNSADL